MRLIITCCVLVFAFGCETEVGPPEIATETRDEVTAEPDPSIVDGELAESAQVCQQWFCVARKPGTDCEGHGVAQARGRCNSDALHDCNANCGGGCVIVSVTCDFPP